MYYKDIPPDLQKYVPKTANRWNRIKLFKENKIMLIHAFHWGKNDPTENPEIPGQFWCKIRGENFDAARNLLKQTPEKTIKLKW